MSNSRSYAEFFVPESEAASAARARAADLGCTPVGAGAATALTFLAAAVTARTAVEIGTGAGVSGLALFAGMAEDGILTSIDIEAENQRAAKQAFTEGGIAPGRARLINGRALEVLPRLTDAAYDLVLVDAAKNEYDQYVDEAIRLLRVGGILAIDNALWHDKVADPTQRDADTVVLREVGRTVREDERLVPVMIPLGDGLLAAVKKGL
ncbi:O-methyltransferase [Nakamurella lactea]|uniref:O-methyltransferase n=1 Tax=Nakamurella lactea TaxID=459515 RepID=UPI00048E9F3C|nr:O-methyltransferase [Nakamurella lactea]